jgi:hypothetical protein
VTTRSLPPLTAAEMRSRRTRIDRLARSLGFVGRVEYRHAYSRTGGASYIQGTQVAEDLLTVYAEAFERDSNPDDFSLNAMLAHECGHQFLVRHSRLARVVAVRISRDAEEIVASIVGAIICGDRADENALIGKAQAELMQYGLPFRVASRRVEEIWEFVVAFL